ncbi:MAG: hypothetical protein V4494_04205 [Chlamydiota bacterium]
MNLSCVEKCNNELFSIELHGKHKPKKAALKELSPSFFEKLKSILKAIGNYFFCFAKTPSPLKTKHIEHIRKPKKTSSSGRSGSSKFSKTSFKSNKTDKVEVPKEKIVKAEPQIPVKAEPRMPLKVEPRIPLKVEPQMPSSESTKVSCTGPFPFPWKTITINSSTYFFENRLDDGHKNKMYFLRIALKSQESVYYVQNGRSGNFAQLIFEEGVNPENTSVFPAIKKVIDTGVLYRYKIQDTVGETRQKLIEHAINSVEK